LTGFACPRRRGDRDDSSKGRKRRKGKKKRERGVRLFRPKISSIRPCGGGRGGEKLSGGGGVQPPIHHQKKGAKKKTAHPDKEKARGKKTGGQYVGSGKYSHSGGKETKGEKGKGKLVAQWATFFPGVPKKPKREKGNKHSTIIRFPFTSITSAVGSPQGRGGERKGKKK